MRIDSNEILKTTVAKAENTNTTNNTDIQLFESKEQQQSVLSKTTQGTNADVELGKIENSAIPGFSKQCLQIKTTQGEVFNINVFIQSSADIEKVDKLSKTLTKTLSNLPLNILEDMQKECKHIFILKNIPHNIEAKALAIGPLNQIFISSDRMSEEPEEELANTITHELGHLVDRTNTSGNEQCSKLHVKAFNNVKNTLINDLGFNPESHSLAKPSEMFADYYLYQRGNPRNNHRCIELFDTLLAYKADVETLTSEELNSIYGEKTEKIKFVVSEWKKLEKNYDAFLEFLDKGTLSRIKEDAQPMSLEQIEEINNQNKKS